MQRKTFPWWHAEGQKWGETMDFHTNILLTCSSYQHWGKVWNHILIRSNTLFDSLCSLCALCSQHSHNICSDVYSAVENYCTWLARRWCGRPDTDGRGPSLGSVVIIHGKNQPSGVETSPQQSVSQKMLKGALGLRRAHKTPGTCLQVWLQAEWLWATQRVNALA